MHRNKEVGLGEDGYANRSDNAPQKVFSLVGFTLEFLSSVSPSPTRAIEVLQGNNTNPLRLFAGSIGTLLNRLAPDSARLARLG